MSATTVAPVDGGIIPPTNDAGEIILPDDIWLEISGSGGFYQETKPILLETDYLVGKGIESLSLYVEMGSDSTKINGMPSIDNDGNGVPDNYFDGLINITQLSKENLENGETGCPEPGYESFAVCPSDPNNRLKVYIGTYTIEGYRHVGGSYEKIGEILKTLSTVEDIEANEKSGVLLPTVANPYKIDIPAEFNESGEIYLKIKLNLIVSARGADGNANYQTFLKVSVKTR